MTPRDLNSIARDIEARIAEMEAEKAASPRSERRPINQRLHSLRGLLEWVKTRQGYVETPLDFQHSLAKQGPWSIYGL